MIRAFVSDLDGTLLQSNHLLSPTNSAAIAAVAHAGLPFLVATGRPWRWVDYLADALAPHRLAVTSNGAAIYDLAAGEPVYLHPIDAAIADAVMADLRTEFPDVGILLEYGSHMQVEAHYHLDDGFDERLPGVSRVGQARVDGDLLKMVVQHPRVPTEDFAPLARDVIDGRLGLTYSFLSPRGVVELAPAGVSKAHALQVWCDGRGIAAGDVACFGDMPNDAEMLRWCGHPHVMPGAHPDLLTSGLPVLDAPQEDAVGRAILASLPA